MSEGLKTTIFAAVGLVVAVAAVASRPQFIEVRLEESVGQPLFADFDDPAQAARMILTKYDPEMDDLRSFEVARDEESGAWTIPSHAGYPADAETRMRDAALMLVDLTVLGIASEVAGEHAMYGVLEPDRERLRLGDEGVGLQLTFEDRRGQRLASLVIGRQVRDAESQRFVRVPGQDVVYAVEIDPDQLSTRFTDWIERDLLQLTSWDIEDVTIQNYSVDRGMDRVTLSRHFDFSAKHVDNEWELVELTTYEGNQETITELPEDQELNRQQLNDLRNAVDNLQIVNVHRKPRGLTADLKAGSDFLQDRASQDDLRARGFWTHEPPGGDAAELLSAHGEVHIGMQDGVQYVLRFGETAAPPSDEESEGEHRYLFVTARMDEEKFPQPELAPLPELPSESPGEDEESADVDEESAGEPRDEDADRTEDEDAENSDPNGEDGNENPNEDANENGPENDGADEENADEVAEADEDAEEEAVTDREAEEARILQERERINRENQRRLDQWNERLDNARQRVAELNVRFGDWYYVVAEEQYNQIRLSLPELIQDKEADDSSEEAVEEGFDFDIEGEGIDAFRQLQQGGLQ